MVKWADCQKNYLFLHPLFQHCNEAGRYGQEVSVPEDQSPHKEGIPRGGDQEQTDGHQEQDQLCQEEAED